jgi:hypothetical protein
VVNMKNSDVPAEKRMQYCHRCARQSSKLVWDEVSRLELCADCHDHLSRRRGVLRKLTTRPSAV